MNAIDAILKRKSVRSYKKDQISDKELESIVEAGKSGPGGGEVDITVIQKADLIQKINDSTKAAMLSGGGFMKERASLPGYEPVYGAPTLILLTAPDANGQANCSCAAENMLIAATALGLGSCYLMSLRGAFSSENGKSLMEECEVREGNTFFCGVIVGYQDGDAFSSANRKVRNVNYVK